MSAKFDAYRKVSKAENDILLDSVCAAPLVNSDQIRDLVQADNEAQVAYENVLEAFNNGPEALEMRVLNSAKKALSPEEMKKRFEVAMSHRRVAHEEVEELRLKAFEAHRKVEMATEADRTALSEHTAVVFTRFGFLRGARFMAELLGEAGDAADAARILRELFLAAHDPKYADTVVIGPLLANDDKQNAEDDQ